MAKELTRPTEPDAEEDARVAMASGQQDQALTVLMRGYGSVIHRYAAGMLGGEAEADDLLQMVFIEAFRDLPTFQARSTFKTWLFGIARHRCLDELRRRRSWARLFSSGPAAEAVAVVPIAPAAPPPSEAPLDADVEDCLQRLPAAARETMLLRFGQEMSYDEMTAVIGHRPGVLRVRVNRALAALRKCLHGKGGGR